MKSGQHLVPLLASIGAGGKQNWGRGEDRSQEEAEMVATVLCAPIVEEKPDTNLLNSAPVQSWVQT